MTKVEFLNKWRNDRDFRFDAKQKGIRVIGDNVLFFGADHNLKAISGAKVK